MVVFQFKCLKGHPLTAKIPNLSFSTILASIKVHSMEGRDIVLQHTSKSEHPLLRIHSMWKIEHNDEKRPFTTLQKTTTTLQQRHKF